MTKNDRIKKPASKFSVKRLCLSFSICQPKSCGLDEYHSCLSLKKLQVGGGGQRILPNRDQAESPADLAFRPGSSDFQLSLKNPPHPTFRRVQEPRDRTPTHFCESHCPDGAVHCKMTCFAWWLSSSLCLLLSLASATGLRLLWKKIQGWGGT